MKYNLNKLLLAIVGLLLSTTTLAHDFEVDGIYYNYVNEIAKMVAVTYKGSYSSDYNEYSGSVTIPSSVTYSGTTYSVTSIGGYAFYGCNGLKEVTIPNSVTEIGDYAFNGCTGLTSMVVASGNSVYDSRDNCNAIIETTTNTLISGCKNSIISNSVTSIGDRAFYDCTGLTSVTIPNSVTSIGDDAFCKCTGLSSVNYNAENCTSMGSYYCPAFSGCSNLKTLNIGNEVKNIPPYAFFGCTGLTSVTIGNSVTEIGKWAFGHCTGLTSVTIPNSVTSIGDDAFWNCTGLTEVTIGNSVTEIGDGAFYYCTGLTEVNISDLSAWCKIDFKDFDANPLSYAGKLKLNGTEINNLVIPNDITQIKSYAFFDCTGLTEVTIGNSVTSIGYGAFEHCTGLTEVTIPNSVTSIGHRAFHDCTGLTSVTIPNSVTSIGSSAFYGCTGLTSVTIPNSVTSIRSSAFYGCTGLTSVTIPNSVTEIGDWAFYNCGIKFIMCHCTTPPICGYITFRGSYSAILMVPLGSLTDYTLAEEWCNFPNIKEFDGVGGVEGVEADNNSVEVVRYDIHGRQLNEPSRGINIVIYSDGTTRKEIIK